MPGKAYEKHKLNYGDNVEIYDGSNFEVSGIVISGEEASKYAVCGCPGLYFSGNEDEFIYVRFGDNKIDGFNIRRIFKIISSPNSSIINNDYNSICRRCGSGAYIGLFDIDCPKCGKY